jgi:hypothetical protein
VPGRYRADVLQRKNKTFFFVGGIVIMNIMLAVVMELRRSRRACFSR